MAIIYEYNLFSWKNFQDDEKNLGDLERFRLVIETLPDQKLIHTLSKIRGNGRNNNNRRQSQLNVILLISHFARLAGEIAEEICLDELENPYFWTKDKERHPSPDINIVMTEIADRIDEMMHPSEMTI